MATRTFAVFSLWVGLLAASSSACAQGNERQRMLERRAVEAAVWGMPLVSFDAMRQAFLRDAGARYGDVVYLSRPADWKLQTTTPSPSVLYVQINLNTRAGPFVLDVPASTAGPMLAGSLLDAWQTPLVDVGIDGDDKGRGARYVLLPPDYKQVVPRGYLPVRSATYNNYAQLRISIASDAAKGVELVHKIRSYPLNQASAAQNQRHIDVAGKLFDAAVRYDDTFYDSLARMLNEEPVQTRDLVTMGQLGLLGIEKGKDFTPEQDVRDILRSSVDEVRVGFMEAATRAPHYWPAAQWGLFPADGAKAGAGFQTTDRLDVDARGLAYFLTHAIPKKTDAALLQLATARDARGDLLLGDKGYTLRVPPEGPAKGAWTVAAYDLATAAFMRNSTRIGVDSQDQNLQRNADGSVDIHFGPTVAAGQEANWIYTAPGKPWFVSFRMRRSDRLALDKSWMPGDVEPVR